MANITGTQARSDEILRLGKEGKTMLTQVAEEWGCSSTNIVHYLHRLQEQGGYVYLVDGKGYFRIFQEAQ